jgi:hypothetical protein
MLTKNSARSSPLTSSGGSRNTTPSAAQAAVKTTANCSSFAPCAATRSGGSYPEVLATLIAMLAERLIGEGER